MRYLNLFRVNFHKEYLELRRYFFDTVSMLVSMYFVFLAIFLGFKALGGRGPNFGSSISGFIVGYALWFLAVAAYSDMSFQISVDALRGTLEQLYMSPLGFPWIMLSRTLANFFLNIILMGVLLAAQMLTTGYYLHIDVIAIFLITFVTMFSLYGLGLVMGGVALIVKKVKSFIQIIQFALIAVTMVSVQDFPSLKYLPLAFGTEMMRKVMIRGYGLADFSITDFLYLFANSAFYFAAGFFAFKFFERKAMKEGSLGQY